MSKVVESVVFVPFTPNSTLKNQLQTIDEMLAAQLGAPSVRFVERSGDTIVNTLGRTNPWSDEFVCGRVPCLPCDSRLWLQMEAENQQITKDGETPIPKPSKKDCKAMASCTSESIGYTVECGTCRLNGVRRIYIGESSRSGHQRGNEHLKDIEDGNIKHPMVQHFFEEHCGRRQEIVMKIVSKHQTALDRQVAESV